MKTQEGGGVVKKLCIVLEKASLTLTPSFIYFDLCALKWNRKNYGGPEGSQMQIKNVAAN